MPHLFAVTARLPRLRRRRRRINFADIAVRFHRGIAEVDATIEPFAETWDEWNHEALRQDGPLWIALGDSAENPRFLETVPRRG